VRCTAAHGVDVFVTDRESHLNVQLILPDSEICAITRSAYMMPHVCLHVRM
jgi:hypothetical protein